jgi:3-dehydrosphinganine reductase
MSGGRHVVVTGGSSGLGRSVAAILAGRGDRVSLVARDPVRLAAAAAAMPGRVECRAADVTDPAALERAMADLVRRSGPCDVLIAAAGGSRPGRFPEMEPQVFRDQMELNYFGVLNAVRCVVPSMVQRGSGSVVAVASTAALIGVYGLAAYSPSKFAVRGLMEVLRAELRPHGIHVACVFPPDMDTPGLAAEIPTKPEELAHITARIRLRHPDDVARVVVRRLDRRRCTITADPQSALLARVAGLLSPVVHGVTDHIVREVQRKSG